MCLDSSEILKRNGSKPADASPERSLHTTMHATSLSWCKLAGEKAFTRHVDSLGAWHSHFAEFSVRFARAAAPAPAYMAQSGFFCTSTALCR